MEKHSEKKQKWFNKEPEDMTAEQFSNSLVNSLNEYSATPGRFSDDVTFIVIDIL